MIGALLAVFAAMIALLVTASLRSARSAFGLAAVPLTLTFAWAVSQVGRPVPTVATLSWVPGLDLTFSFRIDGLATLMTLVVAGIGAVVFVYAADYLAPDAPDARRLAATMLAFAVSMLGLVWADSVWTLFVFWELTSVTSFLLVGHHRDDPDAQRAARRALILTASGGLALLAGLVVLVDDVGSASLTGLEPISGTSASVAAVLITVAAATKSAQVPFHMWLPGAMAAPTPVSAYLHSATMVKAGVLLMALVAPALSDNAAWTDLGLTVGLVSMFWGAVGALRQLDAKLILAWGTISQLGLMIALLSLGTPKATFAAVSLLAAHAVFKAALFMIVGEIDVRTGTRDVTQTLGLRRSMPVAFWVAVVSGASMAGVPLMLGFPAKEAAIEAVLGLNGSERLLVASAVILGSALTVAYSVRLLIGLFGGGPEPLEVGPRRPAMTVATTTLAMASVAGYVLIGRANAVVVPAAVDIDAQAEVYELLRWPGFTTALATSLAVLAVGTGIGVVTARRIGAAPAPHAVGADLVDEGLDRTVSIARLVVGRIQHGSLPVYVATMAATVALAAIPFLSAIDRDTLYGWDSPVEPVLGVLVVATAAGAAVVRSRLGAALGLGAVGIGVTGLFLAHGDPDLALTQLLVETVVVVGFVLGLGHLTRRFPTVGAPWRGVRLLVAALVGIAVAAGLASSGSAPNGEPPVDELARLSVDEGGGKNVVNVILTDIRALDTLGEVIVLATVAIGILALADAGRRARRP